MPGVWFCTSAQVVFSPSLYLIFSVFQSRGGDFSSLKLELPDTGQFCTECVFVCVGESVFWEFFYMCVFQCVYFHGECPCKVNILGQLNEDSL